jgi:hypothetical protein
MQVPSSVSLNTADWLTRQSSSTAQAGLGTMEPARSKRNRSERNAQTALRAPWFCAGAAAFFERLRRRAAITHTIRHSRDCSTSAHANGGGDRRADIRASCHNGSAADVDTRANRRTAETDSCTFSATRKSHA